MTTLPLPLIFHSFSNNSWCNSFRCSIGSKMGLGNAVGIIQRIERCGLFLECITSIICNDHLLPLNTLNLSLLAPTSLYFQVMALLPGGGSGNLFQSYMGIPSILEVRIMLRVSWACGVSLSQSCTGNSLSVVQNTNKDLWMFRLPSQLHSYDGCLTLEVVACILWR